MINDKCIDKEEVLGINLCGTIKKYEIESQNNSVKLHELIGNMIMKLINNINNPDFLFKSILKYNIRPKVDGFNTLADWYECMYSEEKRIKMIEMA